MKFPEFLRIAVVHNTNLVLLEELYDGYYEIVGGYEGEFIKICAQILKFSYNIIPAKEGGWGNYVNGSWNGAVGLVYNNEADLAISSFGVTHDRLRDFDMSYPYVLEDLTFAIQKPQLVIPPDAFVRPFTKELWFSIFTTFMIISLLFSNLHKIDLIKSMLQIFGILISQSVKIKHKNIKDKFVAIAWILGSQFLAYCYMSVLLAHLTVPDVEKHPDNFKELATEIIAKNYKAMAFKGSNTVHELESSAKRDIEIISQHIQENNHLIEVDKEAVEEAMEKEKFALICPKTTFRFLLFHDEFFIAEDSFKSHHTGIVMSKTFCCKNRIDHFIHYLASSGIYFKLLEDAIFRQSLKSNSLSHTGLPENEIRSLSLDDMSGAFLLIIVGHALASVVFFVEIVSRRRGFRRMLT